MCTGLEIAAIGATVLAAGGAVYSAQQQNEMARYQIAQAKENAKMIEADAVTSQANARVEADRIRKAGVAQAARARASLAASGVNVDAGNALLIQSDITGDAEQDAYQTILNGDDQGYKMFQQARIERNNGQLAAFQSRAKATSSLLSAGGEVAQGWIKPLRAE